MPCFNIDQLRDAKNIFNERYEGLKNIFDIPDWKKLKKDEIIKNCKSMLEMIKMADHIIKNDEIKKPKKTFAEITKTGYKRNETQVIIMNPEESEKVENFNDNMKKISNVLQCTQTNKIKKASNGKVIIEFPNSENAQKAEKLINASDDIKYKAYVPDKLKAKMIIKNVYKDTLDNEIISSILNKNPSIKDLVDEENKIEFVFSKSTSEHFKSVIIKVDPKVRKCIYENRCKIYIGLQMCNVSDHFHVIQCFHCQRFGHKAHNCFSKDKSPTCLYCSEKHKSKDCPTKMNKSSHKCINCINKKLSNSDHTTNSKLCPEIKFQIQRVRDITCLESKN